MGFMNKSMESMICIRIGMPGQEKSTKVYMNRSRNTTSNKTTDKNMIIN